MGIDIRSSVSDPFAIDRGNMSVQGRVVSKTVRLGLFTSNANAVWGSKQMLRKESYPFAQVSFPVNRDMFRLQVGDVFKWSYDPYSVSDMILRVVSIEEASLDSEEIVVHCIEDWFSVLSVIDVETDPEELTPEPPDASEYLDPLEHLLVFEVPYVFALNTGTQIELYNVAARERSSDLGFQVHFSFDGGSSFSHINTVDNFKPYGTLNADYTDDTYMIDCEVGFVVDLQHDASLVETVTWEEVFSAQKNLALLGNEVISFKTITPVSGTLYEISDIVRARYDTERVEHSAGEDFWVFGSAMEMTEHVELLKDVDRDFKYVPYDVSKTGDISESTNIDFTPVSRVNTPYRPANLRANGSKTAARYTTDIVLEWDTRYRGLGAGLGIFGTVLPPSSISYELYVKVEVYVSAVKVREVDSLQAETWTYTQAMNVSDNGALASDVVFKVSHYNPYALSILGSHTSNPEYATVTCSYRP